MTSISEYQEYIASEEWQARRKAVLEFRGLCERCSIPRFYAKITYDQDLHVHHRNYIRVGCELDSDLEVLCRRCHDIESTGRSDFEFRGKDHFPIFVQAWLTRLRDSFQAELTTGWITSILAELTNAVILRSVMDRESLLIVDAAFADALRYYTTLPNSKQFRASLDRAVKRVIPQYTSENSQECRKAKVNDSSDLARIPTNSQDLSSSQSKEVKKI